MSYENLPFWLRYVSYELGEPFNTLFEFDGFCIYYV
jgi:hypothetical protein